MLLSVALSSVYFEKEVEKPRLTNGHDGRERKSDGEGKKECRGGGRVKEPWEVLEK